MDPLNEILRPARLTSIVDIGANPIDGDPPYRAMLAAGLCEVTGFEPQESAFQKLEGKRGPRERYLRHALADDLVVLDDQHLRHRLLTIMTCRWRSW